MFGLDEIGGIWQTIGETIIIAIMFVGTFVFWSMVTSTAMGIFGSKRLNTDDDNTCDHEFVHNHSENTVSCKKCPEVWDFNRK